jgi:hypothetical protein
MMKKLLPAIALILVALTASAQNYAADSARIEQHFKKADQILNVLRDFRFDAYAQVEWQRADTAGISSVQGGNFPVAANNRFLVRRGRFRLTWQHEIVNKCGDSIKVGEFMFQMDATEKGFNSVKDFYGRIADPWTGWFSFEGGIFRRAFGYEAPIVNSTSESPEQARVIQLLMPQESELGATAIIESPRTFKPVYFRVDAAVVNGTGIGSTGAGQSGINTGTYQSAKDFIGRIFIGRIWIVSSDLQISVNASGSVYNGRVLQTTNNVYEVVKNSAGEDIFKNVTAGTADTAGKYHTYYARDYYGGHLQLNLDYKIAGKASATTMLRGEYISGTEPGTSGSSAVPLGTGTGVPTTTTTTYVETPTGGTVPVTLTTNGVDLYIRKFNGIIATITQSFHNQMGKQTINQDLVFKFDSYNPNTQVTAKGLTKANNFGTTDLTYNTFSFGYTISPLPYFKLMLWYDHVVNESSCLAGFTSDYKKDDVFTLRTQFTIDTWWFNKRGLNNDNQIVRQY